jgi:hypothetical protein
MNELLRKIGSTLHRVAAMPGSMADGHFLASDVPMARTVSHANWRAHLLQLANRPGFKVLEVGSREVTGNSSFRRDFDQATYVGFDYYPGRNVDVVGDAHALSTHFQPEESISSSPAPASSISRCPGSWRRKSRRS